MIEKKYIVIGSKVFSKYDGDVHYISPVKLIQLHGLKPSECFLFSTDEDFQRVRHSLPELRRIRASYHGSYRKITKE